MPRTIGVPQTRVTSALRSPSPRQVPITSSFRSISQSGLSSTTTSVKSATAFRSAGLPSCVPDEGDVAEVLARLLGPVHGGDGGHVDAPAPAALREPGDLAGRAAGLGDVGLAGLGEGLAQLLGPAAVGQALDAGVGDEAGKGRLTGGMGGAA